MIVYKDHLITIGKLGKLKTQVFVYKDSLRIYTVTHPSEYVTEWYVEVQAKLCVDEQLALEV